MMQQPLIHITPENDAAAAEHESSTVKKCLAKLTHGTSRWFMLFRIAAMHKA